MTPLPPVASRSHGTLRTAALLGLAGASLFAAETSEPPRPLGLIPWPTSVERASGSLTLTAKSRIVAGDPKLAPLAQVLSDEILRVTGLQLAIGKGEPGAGDVLLAIDPALKDEAYALEVKDRAVVKGGDYPSVASGSVTLLQALEVAGGVPSLPHLTVADKPVHPYRGAMIDLARKYHSPDGVKQVIELCRLYKIRYLHVHLSDDQLFMFPSTKFPQVGKGNGEFARFEPGSKPRIEPYTRDELADLERFSQARGVHIVPEIDMPGHAGRLIGDAGETFGFPGSGSTLNIGSPKTLAAITTLWNEVMDIFQGTPYVHLGGDEAGLGGLEGTPEFKELQRQFPDLKGAHDLYCKFMRDMHGVFAKRGKKMIVWEEGCNPGGAFPLPKDTLIMVWCQGRNPADIVKQGYAVVNATWTPLYIVRDNRKTPEFLFNWAVAKFGREGSNDFNTLQDATQVAGAQLCSWENSEAIEIQSMRERLALVGERAWNPRAGGTYAEFKARHQHTDAILDELVHPITIQVQGQLRDGDLFEEPLTVTLAPKKARADLSIKYTLDNTLPNDQWKIYTAPIKLEQTAFLRAGLFDKQGVRQGYLVGNWFRGQVPVKPNLATKKPVTVGPGPDRTDGWFARIAVDGWSNDVGSHWASSGEAPQWLQIDLEKVYPLGSINVITYYDGSRYYQLNAEVSVDGKEWKKVLEFKDTIPATAAGYSGTFAKTDARYVRINMLKNSANPNVHIVEVIVNEAK
ncbi:MAG: family 20 glycosylhydrolase [Verrucomicrobia bacterium]|nr:family 20 glycosylhydrolase [Verrucomicrobiota bacterium]